MVTNTKALSSVIGERAFVYLERKAPTGGCPAYALQLTATKEVVLVVAGAV
jgi:hypothetical protein